MVKIRLWSFLISVFYLATGEDPRDGVTQSRTQLK